MRKVLALSLCCLWLIFIPRTPRAADAPARSAAACYDIRVETVMPHLEDNLRYADTQETRCLETRELHGLFPVLRHPALAGCSLGPEERVGEAWQSPLLCMPDHGTQGLARWRASGDGEVGELNVRLGGKNMTFSQRVTAHLLKSASP